MRSCFSDPRPAARRALCLLFTLVGVAACGGGSSTPTDPTAGVTVLAEEPVAISSQICHIKGSVLNTSPKTTLNITLVWQPLDANGKVLGETGVELDNVPPGATVSFEATAVVSSSALVPCSKIANVNRTQTTFVQS